MSLLLFLIWPAVYPLNLLNVEDLVVKSVRPSVTEVRQQTNGPVYEHMVFALWACCIFMLDCFFFLFWTQILLLNDQKKHSTSIAIHPSGFQQALISQGVQILLKAGRCCRNDHMVDAPKFHLFYVVLGF